MLSSLPGGVHLVAVSVDYSEHKRVLVEVLASRKPALPNDSVQPPSVAVSGSRASTFPTPSPGNANSPLVRHAPQTVSFREADGLKTGRFLVYLSREKRSHCERQILPSDWRLRQLGIVNEPSDSGLSGNRPWTILSVRTQQGGLSPSAEYFRTHRK
jgi:hypothetical protein